MSGSAGTGCSLVILDLSLDSDDDRESGQGHTRSWIVILDLLCQYFPNGSDLSVHTAEDLKRVADILNNHPRKRHGFRTPNEVMTSLIEEDLNRGVATISRT